MEKTTFNFSTKNIPFTKPDCYLRKLIESTEKFIRAMRWRAFFFLHPDAKNDEKETYGFNSWRSPPSIPEMVSFEDSLRHMIQTVKFKKSTKTNPLQQELKQHLNTIQTETKVFVKADKTSNFYKMDPDEYNLLLNKNIHKNYCRANDNIRNSIATEEAEIIHNIQLQDRIEKTAVREAFITLKDHKPAFPNNPACRLINPTKTELGKASKKILQNITTNILSTTNANLWRKTTDVIKWFKSIPKKSNTYFISFDIVDFYPSINEVLLQKALNFAKQYHNITKSEEEIIFHTKKCLLYNKNMPWIKKEKIFDVTMGSFDGAETCEVVGLYLLSQLKDILGDDVGLYRDDGLAMLSNTPKEIERIKKKICAIFKQNNLKITIEANKKSVNYLDVTLDIHTNSYSPYKKPNDTLLYVSTSSNHPPSVIKAIPTGIQQRLSNLSSNEDIFNKSIPEYQEALRKSGHNYQLNYTPINEVNQTSQRKRKRTRKITWFNPPFDAGVHTNIGKEFHKLLSTSFPANHKLHKIFNKNTVKLSYSCMPNFKMKLDSANKQKMNLHESSSASKDNQNGCNCRDRKTCPLMNKCLSKGLVYQATVKTQESEESYVGMTETTFKLRYANHKQSFNNPVYRNQTELSKYIWSLKDKNLKFQIAWKILCFADPYNNCTKRCNLCITEKWIILCKPELGSLNCRVSLVSSCPHKNKFLSKI